jgi:hypothetical protein
MFPPAIYSGFHYFLVTVELYHLLYFQKYKYIFLFLANYKNYQLLCTSGGQDIVMEETSKEQLEVVAEED